MVDLGQFAFSDLISHNGPQLDISFGQLCFSNDSNVLDWIILLDQSLI